MPDSFLNSQPGLSSPPENHQAIVPNDTNDLVNVTRAINVQTAGVLQVTLKGGTTGPVYVGAGIPFPLRATRVWATGTTATGIVGMW